MCVITLKIFWGNFEQLQNYSVTPIRVTFIYYILIKENNKIHMIINKKVHNI